MRTICDARSVIEQMRLRLDDPSDLSSAAIIIETDPIELVASRAFSQALLLTVS